MIVFVCVLNFVSLLILILGFEAMKYTPDKKTACWGVSVALPKKIMLWRKLFLIGIIMVVISIIIWIWSFSIVDFWDIGTLTWCSIIAMLLPIVPACYFGEKMTIKAINNSDYALVLGKFEPLAQANSATKKASSILFFYDGLIINDEKNFPIAQMAFHEFSLGNLESAKQELLLASYFMQKNPNEFKLVVDSSGMSGNGLGSAIGWVVSASNANNVNGIKLVRR